MLTPVSKAYVKAGLPSLPDMSNSPFIKESSSLYGMNQFDLTRTLARCLYLYAATCTHITYDAHTRTILTPNLHLIILYSSYDLVLLTILNAAFAQEMELSRMKLILTLSTSTIQWSSYSANVATSGILFATGSPLLLR